MRFLTFAAILLLFSGPVIAEETTPPEKVGLSSKHLEKIDQGLKDHIAEGKINGASLSIMRKGKLVYHKAFGTRGGDAAKGPLKVNDIHRIYSMTKPITSVGIMMLVEKGKINLNDPVSRYIPAFSRSKVLKQGQLLPVEKAITIKDLLRHTSGIVYGFFGDTEARTEYKKINLYDINKPTAQIIDEIASLPLEHQPGTTWEYSHSTDVLGHIIEIVSGQKLDTYLSEKILSPLGMKDTAFSVPLAKKNRVVEPTFQGLSDPFADRNYLSGGGGLFSTSEDYLKFTSMMLNKGIYDGTRYLEEKTIEMMTSNQLGSIRPGNYDLLGKENGFGLGVSIRLTKDGQPAGSKGDYWWGGYAGTYFWIDPQKEMIAVYMMQQPDQRRAMRSLIRNWVYAALMD
ncbi:serine hydrolase domain-containing protein [Sneathiella aquimaris]|uniref:serine hydrolase domain-containing protein n=1 Tax=Sneathiella aquimaris TaxID=2599305 RepID=UPI00146AF173|nr:serine hydrolase domain-containing protein [Sneathiella aquimaris]